MSGIKFNKMAQIIEERIENGRYPAGSKLPTHRDLAEQLATTPVTIAKAYKQLSERGIVESFVGRGTFVCEQSELTRVIQSPDEEHHYNFSILQPCLYKNIQPISDAYQFAAKALTTDLIGYTEHSGHEAHRKAGVCWAQHYGLEGGTTENTLLTDGAQHALSLLIAALTKPGDTIAVENLTYPGILSIGKLYGRNMVSVPMDAQGVTPDGLENVIRQHNPKLVIIVPSHQNPTGVTMPESRRREIAQVIDEYGIWLIEDDIYCFLDTTPLPAISNFVPDRSFHISALSKAISPAMRCGFIKVPDNQITRINAYIRTNIWLSSPINYLAATQMIQSGDAFQVANVQRQTALERQELACSILPSAGITSTGYHLWYPLPKHWKADHFTMEAKQRSLLVSSGSYFDVTGYESTHIRLSLMSINSEQRLQEGLYELKSLLECEPDLLFPF